MELSPLLKQMAEFSLCSLARRERVADIGSGLGFPSLILASHVSKLATLDASATMTKRLAGRVHKMGLIGKMHVLPSRASALPFRDESFDGVSLSSALNNMSDPGTSLAEIVRQARPGFRGAARIGPVRRAAGGGVAFADCAGLGVDLYVNAQAVWPIASSSPWFRPIFRPIRRSKFLIGDEGAIAPGEKGAMVLTLASGTTKLEPEETIRIETAFVNAAGFACRRFPTCGAQARLRPGPTLRQLESYLQACAPHPVRRGRFLQQCLESPLYARGAWQGCNLPAQATLRPAQSR